MGFISNLTYKEFDEYIKDIFDRIINKINVDSGSLIILNGEERVIFKIEKNLKVNIDKISIGNIDKLVLKKKEPMIINDENLSKLNITGKKKHIASAIVFPLFFKERLIGIINLNREKNNFEEKDLKYLLKERKYLLPSIYNIILLEEIHEEKERFNKYVNVMELIVESYSETKTIEDFMDTIIKKMKEKFRVTLKFIEYNEPIKNGLIKIGDKFFEIKHDYEYDSDIIEKIKKFFEKVLLIKHAEELNKILENYSDLAKETLLMNFVSWDLIQEINSALTSLNLITFFFEKNYPDMVAEIKKSINRIRDAIIQYKNRFYTEENIEIVNLKNVLVEIGKKLMFLNPNIKFNIRSYTDDAHIYGSKNILLNAILNIQISILKYVELDRNIIFDVDLTKNDILYILKISCNTITCKISSEFEKNINISKNMLSNYHINLKYYCENNKKIIFIIEIPAKSE
ncbi:hypothetical protein X275_02120 [Marinitoga sp. 1197]|uniref:GAF domain-containing protein n=1 Tax=Marinitoga sp. 1197 TaxID=1428449 RepID=UPI0006410694|nr:GAF domain-containing protein [Marinitoga sp. 1197]KLO23645.1 hypothetical protein X275_02120 [Marinitoga sp. 1197]